MLDNIKKISYAELKNNMMEFNSKNNIQSKGNDKYIKGVIVFTENSFEKVYPLESRSYLITSDNKAFIPNMGGYSIFGGSLDKTDPCVRLEQYMAAEGGGENGWKVDYCYMLGETEE